MTKKKILEVITFYEEILKEMGFRSKRFAADKLPKNRVEVFGHLLNLMGRMKKLIKQGRKEKAFRWLGFIQGALWVSKVFTIKELKNHSKPKKQRGGKNGTLAHLYKK